MLFLFLWLAIAVICGLFAWLAHRLDWDWTYAACFTAAIAAMVFFVVALIGIPISHTTDTQMLEDRPALVEKMHRTDLSAKERAQLTLDICEFNEGLLHRQIFYPRNRIWFGWYHNEEVLMLEPIK